MGFITWEFESGFSYLPRCEPQDSRIADQFATDLRKRIHVLARVGINRF